MTAHTRTASLSPGITPAISLRTSTSRFVLVAASFVIEAVIVLAFVSSSLGLGAAPYPGSRPWLGHTGSVDGAGRSGRPGGAGRISRLRSGDRTRAGTCSR